MFSQVSVCPQGVSATPRGKTPLTPWADTPRADIPQAYTPWPDTPRADTPQAYTPWPDTPRADTPGTPRVC